MNQLTAETLLQALQGQLPDQEIARLMGELSALPPGVVWNLAAQAGLQITGDAGGATIVTGSGNVLGSITGDGNVIGSGNIVVEGEGAAALAAVLRESLERGRTLHQLRPPVADFVGREQQIATLINALRGGGRAAISGISGLGGIGKTELALKVASELCTDYPDAQLLVELHGIDETPRTSADVLAACIRAFLGPEVKLPEAVDDLTARYLSQLNGKRVLVVLDNAADNAQVRPLLPPSGCGLLITSRSMLTLPGMTRLLLEQLTPPEAHALLTSIASRIPATIADRIASLCGYLPLALRAAGSLLDVTIDLDPADYAGQLSDERTRLERLGVEGVEVGVESSFNLSYARLEPDAAQVFASLSVFPDSFDAKAAEAVCKDTGHVHLSDLVRRSLVQYDSVTARYRLHDLARLFAAARLGDANRAEAQNRHAAHYRSILAKANTLYLEGGASLLRGLNLFDAERANIHAGQTWAVAHAQANDEAASLCLAYPIEGAYVFHLRQHPRERITWLEAALSVARRVQHCEAEAVTLGNLGNAYANLGETRRAIEYYEQHLTIAREIGDRRAEGNALGSLGNAFADLGMTRRAIEFHEQALTVFRETGDRRGEGNALGNLGLAYANLGDPRYAIEYYEQHLIIAREIGDRRAEGTVLGNLGNAYANLGETLHAIEFYEQYLTITREIGDRRGEGNAVGGLGIAYRTLGETRRAIQFHGHSLTIAREIGDRRGESNAVGNLGIAFADLGETRRAIEFYEQDLTIAREIGDRRGEGNTLGNLGSAYADLGENRRAIEFYQQQLTIAREIGDRRGEGSALFNMSVALDILNDRVGAIVRAEAALAIYEQIESPHAARVREQLAQWRGQA